MLQCDDIYIFEGNDVDKKSMSKERIVCDYLYFRKT